MASDFLKFVVYRPLVFVALGLVGWGTFLDFALLATLLASGPDVLLVRLLDDGGSPVLHAVNVALALIAAGGWLAVAVSFFGKMRGSARS